MGQSVGNSCKREGVNQSKKRSYKPDPDCGAKSIFHVAKQRNCHMRIPMSFSSHAESLGEFLIRKKWQTGMWDGGQCTEEAKWESNPQATEFYQNLNSWHWKVWGRPLPHHLRQAKAPGCCDTVGSALGWADGSQVCTYGARKIMIAFPGLDSAP